MPSPYPDDFKPQTLTHRSMETCRGALRRHFMRTERYDDVKLIDDILVDSAVAIRDQGVAAWSAIWTARTDDMRPQDAGRAWRTAMTEWAETNLIG